MLDEKRWGPGAFPPNMLGWLGVPGFGSQIGRLMESEQAKRMALPKKQQALH